MVLGLQTRGTSSDKMGHPCCTEGQDPRRAADPNKTTFPWRASHQGPANPVSPLSDPGTAGSDTWIPALREAEAEDSKSRIVRMSWLHSQFFSAAVTDNNGIIN